MFFFALLAKKYLFYWVGKPIEIDLNLRHFFRHLNRLKIFKKIDLNWFKMDLSEIPMDFNESENPSKSI